MMTAQTICLALLHLGDATGYEIRKCVSEGAFRHFVEASYGSIYPALSKMEAQGLLSVRIEAQDRKPNRRVYSITPAGRTKLRAAYAKPTRADTYRSEFLFLSMFAQSLPRHIILKAVDDQTQRLKSDIAAINDSLCNADNEAARWVAECGLACLQAQLDYISTNRDRLLRLAARPAPTHPPVDDPNFVTAL